MKIILIVLAVIVLIILSLAYVFVIRPLGIMIKAMDDSEMECWYDDINNQTTMQ